MDLNAHEAGDGGQSQGKPTAHGVLLYSEGAPRIQGELLKLGIDIGETSVSKYLVCSRKPPSQTWRPFPENHLQGLVSVDFFTVPTIRIDPVSVPCAGA